MNDFKAAGFNVESEEDIGILFSKILKSYLTQTIKGEDVDYVVYQDPSGAEIWMTIQKNGRTTPNNIDPDYASSSTCEVYVEKELVFDKDFKEGGYYVWSNPEPDGKGLGDSPLVLNVPNFEVVRSKIKSGNYKVAITAFARRVDYSVDEKEYFAKQDRKPIFAVGYFVPSGTFTDDDPPKPLAMFSGTIKKVSLKKNGLGGRKFYAMTVDSLPGLMDVVCDASLFKVKPEVGGIIEGDFWMTGKFVLPRGFGVPVRKSQHTVMMEKTTIGRLIKKFKK